MPLPIPSHRFHTFGLSVAVILCCCAFSAGAGAERSNPPVPETLGYEIIGRYPHDPEAFTQGLAWDRGRVVESTGLYGKSSLRIVDLPTGRVTAARTLDADIFAEGVTVFNDTIFQLTWKNRTIYRYHRETLALLGELGYSGEGWGLTHDGVSLIVSDGSDSLAVLDPQTLSQTGRIGVRDDQGPVTRLNELEYVEGLVFANVWQTNRIAVIDPGSGRVTAWLDLTGLSDRLGTDLKIGELNGIMYDPVGARLFVTGKLWPVLFEIRLTRPGEEGRDTRTLRITGADCGTTRPGNRCPGSS